MDEEDRQEIERLKSCLIIDVSYNDKMESYTLLLSKENQRIEVTFYSYCDGVVLSSKMSDTSDKSDE